MENKRVKKISQVIIEYVTSWFQVNFTATLLLTFHIISKKLMVSKNRDEYDYSKSHLLKKLKILMFKIQKWLLSRSMWCKNIINFTKKKNKNTR